MQPISRRKFLLLSVAFVAAAPFRKVLRVDAERVPPTVTSQPPRAYGGGSFGKAAYAGRSSSVVQAEK